MFVLKLFLIAFSFQIVSTLSAIEDKYLTNQLLEFFYEDSSEDKNDFNQKRSAEPVIIVEDRFASLFSPFNLSRANHYWTRKRGRDQTTPPQTILDVYYTLYPTRQSRFNVYIDRDASRKKREAFEKFLRLNKVSSRAKREVEIDGKMVEEGEKSGKNLETIEKGEKSGKNLETIEKDEKSGKSSEMEENSGKGSENVENEKKERGKWGRFGRKLNQCCNQENEMIFNQTLTSAKAECMIESRKAMRKSSTNESDFTGDGGLYNMFSCDRTKRWKMMVACTIDCVSQKIGMFDSKGLMNTNIAKRIIIENFARQEWEQEVSDKLVEKCAAMIENSTSKPINEYGLECTTKPAEFTYCMWRELFLTCPEEKQEKTKMCDKLRNVLTKFDDNKFKN